MSKQDIVRLKPYQYVHIIDNNTNVTRVLVGPLTYTRLDHEQVLHPEPQNCIAVPPNHYCVIENPVVRKPDGAIMLDALKQIKVRIGDSEIRFMQEPFPLYPGETLAGDVRPLTVLSPLEALRVRALRDFSEVDDKKKIQRVAGDEWMLRGPCTYTPRIEVEVLSTIKATVVDSNSALKLRARIAFKDASGVERKAGEEWLYDKLGAYIPCVEEELVEVVPARVLTDRKAIHVEALMSFTDRFGKPRQPGERWLVTKKEAATFIPTPNEKVLCEVPLTTVGVRQYCVVLDVVNAAGKTMLGHRELRKGLTSFFLHPGETLEGGRINNIYVLANDEAIVLSAKENFTDAAGVPHQAGHRWMVKGPAEYFPPIQVSVMEKRKSIPLDVNEGIYIRDTRTGHVRANVGKTVMLNEFEELWEKPLPPLVEELLNCPGLTKAVKDAAPAAAPRLKHKVVTCNVPYNSLLQVYDFQKKEARVVMGPELVSLMPHEEFTVLSLSGGKPKQADTIKALCMRLGPDFMTDIIIVETLDHARLQLQLSYNWEFDLTTPNFKQAVFSVPDFVGDACKAIASRIRGNVASQSFDQFHRNSSQIIKLAVFGGEGSTLRSTMRFKNNGLVITGVDIHSVDPVDPKTREALTKSVQLAIEITTTSQEAGARHLATTLEQEARGRLERQVIKDKAGAEDTRKKLLALESENAAIESTGASKAQSKAQAEAKLIEGKTEVNLAQKRADGARISAGIEQDLENRRRMNELDHRASLYDLEVAKTRALAQVESEKFKKVIAAVGKDTIKALARAGPEMQAKLLSSLGLQGYLVTDGSNPINLFNTAKGMTARPPMAA